MIAWMNDFWTKVFDRRPRWTNHKSDLSYQASNLSTSIDQIMSVQTKATIASFGGKLLKLTHNASTTNCEMGFNLYLPPQATSNTSHKVPLLIYLAGLTCTGDNGAEKGFFQHKASEKGIAVLYPDTSPRASAPIPAIVNPFTPLH